MSDPSTDGTGGRAAEEDPVYLSMEAELRSRYPDWRVTTHYAATGQKVMMIEFAGTQGEFVRGLPGQFISLVSTAGVDDDE